LRERKSLGLMTIFNALFGTIFPLLAASAAVTGSMIVLALFDLAFGKKKPPVASEEAESDCTQIDPSSRAVQRGGGALQGAEQGEVI